MPAFSRIYRAIQIVLLLAVLVALAGFEGVHGNAQNAERFFPETGKTVDGRFLEYWNAHGGLAQQGYPVSEEIQERSDTDGKVYKVQYFERAIFELHPENRQPYDVLLSLLGNYVYRQKYPALAGAPGQSANDDQGSLLFPETNKRVGGSFLEYWQANGGLSQYGYPISEEFQERSDLDGKLYRVQYFERAVFERHPENAGTRYEVLLSQLGTFRYRAKYSQAVVNANGTLTFAESMSIPRACHSATLLPGGKVLIAGGMRRDNVLTASAELFDPRTGAFVPTGSMTIERVCHTATLLPSGKVLIAAGFDADTAELYAPNTGTFARTGSMSHRRDGARATLLNNGKVLITGGYDKEMLSSAELYDPETGTFGMTGPMNEARTAHTAALLPDGRVLIAGGGANDTVLESAEIYDPNTGQFTPTGKMVAARHKHAAISLPDGNVLITGGADTRDWRGRYTSAEIYDAKSGKFTSTSSMSTSRFKFQEAALLLLNGKPFLAGGGKSIEIYDPAASKFLIASNEQLDAARFYSAATLLADGSVLITGGYDTNIAVSDKAWVYRSKQQ